MDKTGQGCVSPLSCEHLERPVQCSVRVGAVRVTTYRPGLICSDQFIARAKISHSAMSDQWIVAPSGAVCKRILRSYQKVNCN